MTSWKIFALIAFAIFALGFASAGCFGSLLVDPDSIKEKTLQFDIEWNTGYGNAFGSSAQGYVVPLNSIMSYQNFGTYTIHCEDGANAPTKPPLKIRITDLETGIDENILVTQNCEGLGDWCQGGCPVCVGGPVCETPDPLTVFTFKKEGVFKVHTEFSPWPAKSEVISQKGLWLLAREDFNVTVFSPVIAIHGSIPALLPIQAGKETSTTINWTIQNLSTTALKIKDINYPACDKSQNLECSIMPAPKGLKIPANGFLLFTQTIKLVNPPEGYAPRNLEMFLDVNYSNEQGLISMKKRSKPVTVKIKPLTQQKFSVKIKGPGENKCYGFNGKTGFTGSSALPRIKLPFDWSWNGITASECDKNYNSTIQDYHYCDAVQFSIELLKKLKRIDEINQSLSPITLSTSEELQRLVAFSSFLMKDGYSKDLQADLSQLLKSGIFAEVPTWYDDFSKIFEDNNKFKFYLLQKGQDVSQAVQLNSNDPTIGTALSEGPGLYEARIAINYTDSSTKSFILSGNPNAEIKVYLTRIAPPVQDSVFYYLPIDGTVGFNSTTQTYDRVGYGISVTGKDLVILSQATQRIILPAANNSGLNIIAISDRNEFSYTNQEARGSVLKINPTGPNSYSMAVSQSNATPVLLRIKQGNKTGETSTPTNNASAFYYIKKNATAPSIGEFVAGTMQESYWTGAVSSNIKSKISGFCLNFDLSKPFNERADSRLDTITGANNETCSLAGGATSQKVYGFAWQNLAKQSDQNFAYYQSVFYTAKNNDYQIFNACSNKDYKIITPTGNKEISSGSGSSSLPLSFDSGISLEALQSMLDAVKSKDLCITTDSSSLDIWWNESTLYQKLYGMLDSGSEFKLNKC